MAIVARNDKGKVLSSIPKNLKESDTVEQLEGTLELLQNHGVECREVLHLLGFRHREALRRFIPAPLRLAVCQMDTPEPAVDLPKFRRIRFVR